MNKGLPAERLVRLAAFGLCALVYAAGLALLFQQMENRPQRSVSVKVVTLSIAQMELQAEPAPMPKPQPREPEPEIIPEEEADVALEEVIEEPQPQPELQSVPMPETEAPVAQVTQEASAPSFPVNPDDVQGWVLEEIEKEKYYPAAAERFGLTGTFDLSITVDADGSIRSAEIISEGGHRILRQAVEKVLSRVVGLRYLKPIGEPLEFEVAFEFE